MKPFFTSAQGPTVNVLPILVVYIVQCQVSLNRINKFINSEELDPDAVSHSEANEAMVKAVNATFTWGEQMKPAVGKSLS